MNLEKAEDFLWSILTTVGADILCAAIVIFAGLKIVKLIGKWIKRSRGFLLLDKGLQTFIVSFISVVLNIAVLITAAVILGIPTTSFITLLASAGVAVGLALQGALSNFAGGLMILFFKPFKVGDVIETSGGKGVVEAITVCYTKLRGFDNKTVMLPNGSITNSAVINFSEKDTRRISLIFSLPHECDIDKVKGTMVSAALANKKTEKIPPPEAFIVKLNKFYIDFELRIWCKTSDYDSLYFELLENIKKELMKDEFSGHASDLG